MATKRVIIAVDVEFESPDHWTKEDIACEVESMGRSGHFTNATVWDSLADFDADRAEGRVLPDGKDSPEVERQWRTFA